MANTSDDQLAAWLGFLHSQQKANPADPTDERADSRRKQFCALLQPTKGTGDDAKSRMLDSSEMASMHEVNRLTKKPDGTTVVHYYFPNDAGEVDRLSGSDKIFQPECEPYKDDSEIGR